jgi:two-component system response regulator YesN
MFRALIVDDARAELEVLLFLIQKNNLPMKTVTAINGEEALDRLRQEEFDILITDIRMPFMDGLTLAGEALTLYPSIKVVISSGYQDFSYAKTAISLGVEEYLLKPVNPSDFISLIVKLTEQIEEERQSCRDNRIKTIYSRDSIMHQLLSGSLRPGRDGLLPREIRTLMPSSCCLILLSLQNKEGSALSNLKPEILHLARQFFSRLIRGILLETDLLLCADSTDESFYEFLKENMDPFTEQIFQMYRIPLRAAAAYAASPEEIPSVVAGLRQELRREIMPPREPAAGGPKELSSQSGKVRFVCDYIASHYQEDLSLESLSKITYVHPDYLSRIFKRETGMNLNRYIKTFRLNQACQLLENSQQKITAISQAVGYQNCAYFIRSFTEMFGQSPEKYRQMHMHTHRE